jgi:hypothetical protein
MKRARRRQQVHMRFRGQPNRKWHQFIHVCDVPDFREADDVHERLRRQMAARAAAFAEEELPEDAKARLQILPPTEMDRVRALVDAQIADMERRRAEAEAS